MLRIIHTGRAYEVIDHSEYPGLLGAMDNLRDKYIAVKLRYWQQGAELEETCREIGDLKALLFDLRATKLEQKLRITELKLKSCQKNTLDTHDPQDPR